MRKLPIELKMEFVFRDKKLAVDLGTDLAINEHDLTTAMLENPSLSAFYASVRSYARRRFRDLAIQEKALRAELFLKHRTGPEGIRPTDKLTEARVLVDPALRMMQGNVSQAEYEADMADAAREAFRDRREMLVNLSADRRAEMSEGMAGARASLDRTIQEGRRTRIASGRGV